MQRNLEDYEKSKPVANNVFNVSEAVRNATFESIKDELPRRRQEIFEIILVNPGITGYEIKGKLHRSHSSFSGRISELYNKNGKYGDKQYIEPCGVDYYPSIDGKMHAFTKWKAIVSEGDSR